jgi:hypothetical protein
MFLKKDSESKNHWSWHFQNLKELPGFMEELAVLWVVL